MFAYNCGMTASSPSTSANAASFSTDRAWRIAGAVFCVLMLMVHVVAALHFAGVTDFWRDAYWATLIAHGERFPLSGPPINQIFELGPWWFYLLALPVWLTGRVVAAVILVQLLAAAKYFLAWRLGTRLLDARFGLACAVSLAFTGWSTADLWFPSHPAVVETCVLLLAFAVLRGWQRLASIEALLFGLAAAACLHAHPTTLLYIALGGMALLYRHRSWRTLSLLGVSLAVVLLSLLPPWLDPAVVFAGASKPLDTYWQKDFGANVLARVPQLWLGLYFGGAWNGFLTMTLWKTATAKFVWYVYCACLAFAATGVVLLRPRLRATFAAALALVVAQIAFLALVRGYTPIWMVPSCLPAAAFGLALGWYGWLASVARARVAAGSAVLTLYAALSLAPFGLFLRELHSVRVTTHANPLFNMSDSEDAYQTVPTPATSVRDLDALGAELCAPVTLHARLGAAMENALAIPARNACGRWPEELRFAGIQGANHLAGISLRAAQAIGIAPDRVVGHMALYTHLRAVAPADGAAAARLQRMQVTINAYARQAGPVEFDFDAAAGDVVALTNRFPLVAPLTLDSVMANDAPAKLLFSEGKGFIYACANCTADAAPVHWHLRGTGIEQYLDLVVLLSALKPG